MNEATEATLLERAQEAAARGDWQQAHDLLTEVDARQPLAGRHLAFRAEVAYAAGHLELTIDTWERAHAEGVRIRDPIAAAGAAVRVAMHLLFDTALMAPVRGWIWRTEQWLEGQDETPVHAWLAMVRAYERLLSGDIAGARPWAARAIDAGTRCAPAAAAIGRVAEARARILQGEVEPGLALLNEAGAATMTGELDPLSTGIVYCELVCALQALAQYDLAEQWTEAMERWHHGQPAGSIHGRCRVHRAEILRLRGRSREAEQEALRACEELRPYLRREFGWPLTELGRIRLQHGDIRGAEEALLGAYEAGWDPQPGLALVRLAQGDVASAAAFIRHALDHPSYVPSKELPPNTPLRRAPLLEAQVEIEVAAGALDRGREAADELARIATTFESKALAASAALATGRVLLAEGDAPGARLRFEEALERWSDVGAPYEAGLARVGLAETCRSLGDAEGAVLEFRAARTAFARIGALHLAARAARAAGDPAPDTAGRELLGRPRGTASEQARPDHLFRREGDYWTVTFEGHTVRLSDRKGLRYLARLLAAPGREIHVLDLVAMERGVPRTAAPPVEPGLRVARLDAGPLLDPQAKEAYRRRLIEIEEDIEEAQALGDIERAAQAEAERDFLVRELARAVGLGGRDRRAGSASERARASVTRAIRDALARVHKHHPPLGVHLDRAIRTGTYCVYLPDTRVSAEWKL